MSCTYAHVSSNTSSDRYIYSTIVSADLRRQQEGARQGREVATPWAPADDNQKQPTTRTATRKNRNHNHNHNKHHHKRRGSQVGQIFSRIPAAMRTASTMTTTTATTTTVYFHRGIAGNVSNLFLKVTWVAALVR